MNELPAESVERSAPPPPAPPGDSGRTTPEPEPGWHIWVWRWYSATSLTHFLTYLPLPLVILFVIAMLANGIGASQGMDKHICHNDPMKRFFVAASLVRGCQQD